MNPDDDAFGDDATERPGVETPTAEPYDCEAMEDSLRLSLPDARFMGIRDHHVIRNPNEIISFSKLLLRWRHNSFYVVSYCAGLMVPNPDKNDKYEHVMRLRIAKKVAVKTTLHSAEDEKGGRSEKRNHEIVVILANGKQDPTLSTFPAFCNIFPLLYFDLSEVEAMEERFPEIMLIDPAIQQQDPLFTTTPENLCQVAPLALYYWHCVRGSLGESIDYIDYSQKQETFHFPGVKAKPQQQGIWKLNDGIHYPVGKWKQYMRLPPEKVLPTLPVDMPVKFKRSRKNDLDEYRPLVEQLQSTGIEDQRNQAKIIYGLFPQLSHSEIGRLFPASQATKPSKGTDRDRGRILLGLKQAHK